jgi:hypothetical protein
MRPENGTRRENFLVPVSVISISIHVSLEMRCASIEIFHSIDSVRERRSNLLLKIQTLKKGRDYVLQLILLDINQVAPLDPNLNQTLSTLLVLLTIRPY